MTKRLKTRGFWVRGVDVEHARFSSTAANDFVIGDLRKDFEAAFLGEMQLFRGRIRPEKRASIPAVTQIDGNGVLFVLNTSFNEVERT